MPEDYSPGELSRQFSRLESHLTKQDDSILALINMVGEIKVSLAEQHENLNGHNKRLDSHDTSFKLIGDRFDSDQANVSRRFEAINTRFEILDVWRGKLVIVAAVFGIVLTGVFAWLGSYFKH